MEKVFRMAPPANVVNLTVVIFIFNFRVIMVASPTKAVSTLAAAVTGVR